MSRPPIRVERKGWSRWFAPTLAELEAAVAWAEADANQYRFKHVEAVQDRIGYLVRQQLQTNVQVEIDGEHLENGDQLVSVWTSTVGPAYARIAVTLIGNEPATAMEAGARAVKDAVERLAHRVKEGIEEIAAPPTPENEIKPDLLLTRKVSPQEPRAQVKVDQRQSGAPTLHASKPATRARPKPR